MEQIKIKNYRNDIDGLRAITILSVILYHFNFLPTAYLSVDIFFTISGYLITRIFYQETLDGKFSILNFYLRRIRRIVPLVLFTSFVALLVGMVVMLPDDLENLSQSVFATNFFANNILLFITSNNYWAIANEYKPLMHTWSLAIEEQFYLVYPLIFVFLQNKKSKLILPVLVFLTLLSLFLFFKDHHMRFYIITHRFFELSIGGIAAIVFRNTYINKSFSSIFILVILAILYVDVHLIHEVKLFLILASTVGLLISTERSKLTSLILENKMMIWAGKVSFSLYMWHQIVLAFARYFVFETIGIREFIILFAITVLLSIFSYNYIEQPFRNPKKLSNKKLLYTVGISFFILNIFALYIYSIGGIIRDIPELGLKKNHTIRVNLTSPGRNINSEYNEKIHDLNKPFVDSNKINVLVVGNSFARDWSNILLESKMKNLITIAYEPNPLFSENFDEKIEKANFIFFSEIKMEELTRFKQKHIIDKAKVWNVGTKNFGLNSGFFYNRTRDSNYCKQKTKMEAGYFEKNMLLKAQWGEKYIDLIDLIDDDKKNVKVFTDDCKLISQDAKHLTRAGAIYFAKLVDMDKIFQLKLPAAQLSN